MTPDPVFTTGVTVVAHDGHTEVRTPDEPVPVILKPGEAREFRVSVSRDSKAVPDAC